MIKSKFFSIITFAYALSLSACKATEIIPPVTPPSTTHDVDVYVTTANKSMLFTPVPLNFSTTPNMAIETTINMNPSQTFQTIDGFGAAITGSTAYNLLKMSAVNRAKLLKDTFDPVTGMGYSFIRISIGCSDFSLDNYTYCDTPGINNFAIHPYDIRDLFPVLKEIIAINPKLKILASPWTCPRWMKVNNLTDLQPYNSWTSGQLNPAYYQDYATYFVKYIQAMASAGFNVDAITIQNEPLNRGNSASLYMSWQEQDNFIKTALGPAFAKAGITTKIIVFDHNYNYDNIADQQEYPLHIYTDPQAAKYVDGAAYHAYGGDKSELLTVHNANPDKNLYFTEMSIGSWNYSFDGDLMWSMREIGIGTLNNFSKSVIVWNFMLDDKGGPFRPGGCNTCYGAVDVSSSDYTTLDKKSHYYVIGHLAKAISPDAVRIGTTGYQPSGLYYTAVLNTDGTYGVVMQNDTDNSIKFTLADDTHSFVYTIPAKSIASFRWKK
jgi:glucosylceramidase